MPQASAGAAKKYAWMDHDGVAQVLAPPIQNQWYTVFTDDDVRLLWCAIVQTNTETAAKTIQIKWTIDGTVYYAQESLANNTMRYVYKDWLPSTGGTTGLNTNTLLISSAFYVDKRGQSFKVEIRMTSAPGTAQTFNCYCIYETLEVT